MLEAVLELPSAVLVPGCIRNIPPLLRVLPLLGEMLAHLAWNFFLNSHLNFVYSRV